jgi:fumarate reductase subunit C
MVREFTAVPITLWLLSLLILLARVRAGAGAGAESPLGSPAYVVFSVICLIFALYHSWTWLGISGLILRIPLGERDLPPRLVTAANYALWGVASVVIGAALILLWR